MPDFSLLSTPNFAQAALSGYQAGAAQAKQNQLDSALGGIDLERPETLLPVLRADPSTGAALIGSSVKLAAEKRQQQSALAQAQVLRAALGGGSSSSMTVPATTAPTTSTSGTPVPNSTDPADVVVTGQRQPTATPSLNQSVSDLVGAGGTLGDAKDLVGLIGSLHDTQLKSYSDQSQLEAQLLGGVKDQASYNAAVAQAARAGIDVSGIPAQYNPDWVAQQRTNSLKVKDQLDYQLQVRAADRADATQAETMRHNRVDEGQGAARIGLEAQNVGIAGAHLALARNADARAATTAAATAARNGGAGIGIPTPQNAAQYNALPSGARYVKNGQIRIKQ